MVRKTLSPNTVAPGDGSGLSGDHSSFVGNGHWALEGGKEGHMSEFLPSPGVKNLVLDTFCVFLEPLNVD